MKVLMAVGETNRGGTETWLLHVARELQGRCQIDFLVHSNMEGAYDRELAAVGARVIPCGNPGNPIAFAFSLFRILRSSEPYHVVHSHVQCYSAWVLLVGWLARVPVRIAHSHSDLNTAFASAGFKRRLYMRAMKALLRLVPTHYLATSPSSAVSLFGNNPYHLHTSCVDLAPFALARNTKLVRHSLGIAPDAIVVGHVGSFRPEKNHKFALQVAARLAQLSPRYQFLFKGDGPLKAGVRQLAVELGIADRCFFLPADGDVPRVLCGAVDMFLFPSTSEGLGLAAIEAQAAGLPCFVSEGVPPEAIPIPGLVQRLTLDQGPDAWALHIHAQSKVPPSIAPAEALALVRARGFDIRRNADDLLTFYRRATAPPLRDLTKLQHYSPE